MNEREVEKFRLQGSLLEFIRIFYKIRTGRLFELSNPIGRESHYITICRELVGVLDGKTTKLIINVPPRYGKTEILINFVAWSMANYPDSNFMYVSYSHSLAKEQTQVIREIINTSHYRKIFGIEIRDDTSAKDNFKTNHGGSVYATGAGGTITGRGAGIKGVPRFGGAFIMDDMHKPDEVTSDTMRESVINWFYNTAMSRVNSPNTPFIFIGQRLHEGDLPAHLIESGDWKLVNIPALDQAGNALHPEMHSVSKLLSMKEKSPYEFSAQYQQDPQPAGGGIFKEEWFYLTNKEPKIISTFITADTAETNKNYNDATVFSFFGVYRIKYKENDIGLYGLHWIDCVEIRVEPKDLESEFMDFYSMCMCHHVKPKMAAIEKKSTGVTLLSILGNIQGLNIVNIDRGTPVISKTQRFLQTQPYVASKQISLPAYGRHTEMCIKHCGKITANNSHRFDDICDTLADGVKIALIDKTILFNDHSVQDNTLGKRIMSNFNAAQRIKENRKW